MKKIWVTLLYLVLGSSLGIAQSNEFEVLLFSKTEGYRHHSIEKGVQAIQQLGEEYKFLVSWFETTEEFTDQNLERYDAIIFLNTTGNVLDKKEQDAMEKFIQSGKGFVGIHSASDTEYDWPWYTQLVGRMFETHPEVQEARIKVENVDFPGLRTHPKTRMWIDEWYLFKEEKVDDLNYLITVDESSYNAEAKGIKMGEFHPVSWFHGFDGGRSFYTGMGHVEEAYDDDTFLEHLYGGILWAATGEAGQ